MFFQFLNNTLESAYIFQLTTKAIFAAEMQNLAQ